MRYDITTIGDAFEDVFVEPSEVKVKNDASFTSGKALVFELGEKIPLSSVNYETGGSACNAAVGFRRLGLNVAIVTMMGRDTPAEKIENRLLEEGIDTNQIIRNKKMQTNFAVIIRTDEGRTILIYRGLPDYASLRLKKSLRSKWIFLAPVGKGADEIERDVIAKVAEHNSLLAWNPGAIQIKKGAAHYKNILKNLSVLFLNREEAIKFISKSIRPNEGECAKKLQIMGPSIVVVTNGKNGALAYDGEHCYKVPSLPNVTRVDSTGAGDSFAVGFLETLISSDWSPEKNTELIPSALLQGIANSNSVITKVGAQAGLLNDSEMEEAVKEVLNRVAVEIK